VWKSLFLGSSAQEDLAFMVPIRHDGAGESEEKQHPNGNGEVVEQI